MTIELPMPYYKSTGKALMSVNVYRNMNPYLLSTFKREYGEILSEVLSKYDLTKFKYLKATYELRTEPTKKGKAKKVDMVNILSMVDKVFMDILVKDGWLEDDTVEFVYYVKFIAKPYAEKTQILVTLEEING